MKMLTKTKHNKKRNTAFIYEALVRELTKCIVAKDEKRKGVVLSLIKEHFAKGSILRKELELFKVLYEMKNTDIHLCEKLITEVKRSHNLLDHDEIFNEQTAIINKINKLLSKDVFGNFVPNYKNLATISQILNPDVSVKHRVLLESNLLDTLSSNADESKVTMAPIDNLLYKTFVNKFNKQYEGKLLEEQKELLSKYIASFHDEGFGLKIYLNEEVSRLRGHLEEALCNEEVVEDEILLSNTNRVLDMLTKLREQEFSPGMIEQILKIQQLTAELRD